MKMDELTNWLLDGPPWIQYRTFIDILNKLENDPEVLKARKTALVDSQVKSLFAELSQWPGPVLKSHNNAGHLLHKLTFIADLGFNANDPEINSVINSILEHQSAEGPFQSLINLPIQYGGSGESKWTWMLCDAPLIIYALAKFGIRDDDRVKLAADHLAGLIRENGWPCAVSPDIKFRGPGRKDDPCPYTNLIMLKALSQLPKWQSSSECKTGAETLLTLWEQSRERHPYMFYMGTDFAKLKVPFIWYDILHVLDVLTQFPWLHNDYRLKEMLDIVRPKADEKDHFTSESIWKAWANWEFGQKKEPSRWLTLITWRILKRL